MLGSPHVVRLLGGTLIGRLPNGMAPVAILLWATTSGRSIAFGGLLSALYGLSSALAQPVKGRLMDRYGQSAVHLTAALVNSPLLAVLPLTGPYGGPSLATALVVGGGLTTPPLETGLRTLWPSVLPDPRLRQAALALDAGTQGLLYVVGPLLVAALASVYDPSVALAVAAVLGLIGTTAVALAPPSRHWRPDPCEGRTAILARRLASPALSLLYLSLTGIGFAIGAMNVVALATAERHHQGMLTGIIPAVFSASSFLGGLLYGRRTWPGTTTQRLTLATSAFLAGWLPLLALPAPYVATVAVAVPGAFLTPVVACAYVATDILVPAGRTSEGFAWLILSIGIGQSAGTALAGHLIEHPLATAALPAVGAAFALSILLAARRPLDPTRPLQHGRHRRPTRDLKNHQLAVPSYSAPTNEGTLDRRRPGPPERQDPLRRLPEHLDASL
ncbi:ABC transporter, permease protein [Streptomyces albus]|uniref:ABC transporter, permease protein n=1 Tax=Streptomyces albus (strain ATCC 21838 / DSM 41398 / FERM P-419 / JCM 4703 / NBRC 107858) TaxID=1081613 RepID=A0A0B5EX85_STRA4|nr:ABC transporter, permease protein [Streptomyces albus]AOU81726.1 ABC transporter, permease protein [Streptomyces albus]AYN37416.1 ABC transporter, permease protein [Streptomyces albus]